MCSGPKINYKGCFFENLDLVPNKRHNDDGLYRNVFFNKQGEHNKGLFYKF